MFPAFKNLSDQERHDYILKTYVLNNLKTSATQKHKRDIDVIREHHKFLWEDENEVADSWEKQLARKYYDKLFKEYCIADLTRYKENKVALRWRVENEVVSGKGQFQCGSRKCDEREDLKSWEVNFAYQEDGQRKNALVKLRLCPDHSAQLNYTSRKREIKRLKRVEKHQKKAEKRRKRKGIEQTEEESCTLVSDTETEKINDSSLAAEAESIDIICTPSTSHRIDGSQEQAENIWSKKLEIETEKQTRESEFERYLEDLLL